MARPKKRTALRTRTTTFQLRLSERESAWLHDQAERAGLSCADFVRVKLGMVGGISFEPLTKRERRLFVGLVPRV
jgi:hypothetical protein